MGNMKMHYMMTGHLTYHSNKARDDNSNADSTFEEPLHDIMKKNIGSYTKRIKYTTQQKNN